MNEAPNKECTCPPKFRPRLMRLEDRTVPATMVWDGGGITSNWSEAANWVNDVLPGFADTAVHNATSAETCVVDINVSVASLRVEDDYGGSIWIIEDKLLEVRGNADLHSSAIVGPGVLSVASGGSLDWISGNLGCLAYIEAGASALIHGNGAALVTGQLFNHGSIIAGRQLTLLGGSIRNEGTFTLASGADLVNGGGNSVFVNRGSFEISNSPTQTTPTEIAVNFTNTSDGVIKADGTPLIFRDSVLKQDSDDAKLLIRGNVYVQNFELSAGLVEGPGWIFAGTSDNTGTASWTWTDGYFHHATVMINSNATLNIDHSQAGAEYVFNGCNVISEGNVTIAGNNNLKFWASSFSNKGQFNLNGDNIFIQALGFPLFFSNEGVFSKLNGTGSANFSMRLVNTGMIRVDAGELRLKGDTTSNGLFQTASGTELIFQRRETLWDTGTTFYNAGTVRVLDGKVTLAKDVSVRVPGRFIQEGTLLGSVQGGSQFSAQQYIWHSGEIDQNLRVTVRAGELLTIDDSPNLLPTEPGREKSILRDATLLVQGEVAYKGRGSLKLGTGTTVNVDGAQAIFRVQTETTIDKAGGGGKFVLKNQGLLLNQTDGQKPRIKPDVENINGNIAPDMFDLDKFINKAGKVQLLNNAEIGTLVMEGGTLELLNSRLTVTGTTTATGGTIDLQLSSLVATGGVFLSGSSVLQGTGDISGDLTNAATLLLTSETYGLQLLLGGNYTQTATGTLAVNVGSSSGYGAINGRLVVWGSVDLAGTISVLPLPGSDAPYFGHRFRIMDYSSRTGGTSPTFTGAALGHAVLQLEEDPFGLDLVATTWLDNFDGPSLEWLPDTGGTPATITQQNGRVEFRGSSSPLTKASIGQSTNMGGDFSLGVDFTQNGTGSWRHGVVLDFGDEAIRFTNGSDGEWRIEYLWGTTQYTLFSGSGGGSAGGPETLKVRREGGSLVFRVVRGGVETTITSLDVPTDWYLGGVELIGEAENSPLNLDIDNFRLLGL